MKVLIIEDEKILSDTIKQCIQNKFETDQTYDGYEGYMQAKENIYDVIILDLMLPEMSGYEVLYKLRNEKVDTPVLILSAKDALNDKIKGFNYGADDYLTKPFEREELIARLEAIIRRTNKSYNNDIIKFKELEINVKSRQANVKGKPINLQGKQFDILEYLISSQGIIVTKEQIFDRIWGFDSYTTTNVVEVYTSGLRKILKEFGYDKYIKTIRGVGYMMSN